MKLQPEIEQLLNEQIRNELASSHAYLAISAWFEQTPYAGFAQWMYVQSVEETQHAMKFFSFVVDRDGEVELMAIDKPKGTFTDPVDAFKASLAAEEAVTSQIHAIYSKSLELHDHETTNFLRWFIDEQVEEEKTIRDMIERLELVADNPLGLLQLDQEAAARKPLEVPAEPDGA